MGLFSKKETNPNQLQKYSVLYLGGHPHNPKKTYNIDFLIMKDSFFIQPQFKDKGFVGFEIPFEVVKTLIVGQRQVSTMEGILGGLDSRQLNQPNNINLTYTDSGSELTVRLEMITGVTVMGQAAKCAEMMDFIKANGIATRFMPTECSTSQSAPVSPMDEIKKLKELLDIDAITQDEFDAKKKQLLNI